MSKRLGQMLIRAQVIQPDDLGLAASGSGSEPLGERLAQLGIASEERVAALLAAELGLPREDLADPAIETEALARVPRHLAERHCVFPVAVRGPCLHVAMADPLDLDGIRDVEFRSGLRIRPLIATPSRIRAAIARGYAFEPSAAAGTARTDAGGAAGEAVLDLDAPADAGPAVRMVNLLLTEGLRAGASDVHVE